MPDSRPSRPFLRNGGQSRRYAPARRPARLARRSIRCGRRARHSTSVKLVTQILRLKHPGFRRKHVRAASRAPVLRGPPE